MAIICHCATVRERAIVKAIEHGADSVHAVMEQCGAAAQCGGCEPAVLELLDRHSPTVRPVHVHRAFSLT